jgi:hypothetical protein
VGALVDSERMAVRGELPSYDCLFCDPSGPSFSGYQELKRPQRDADYSRLSSAEAVAPPSA